MKKKCSEFFNKIKKNLFPASEIKLQYLKLQYEIRYSQLIDKMLNSNVPGIDRQAYCEHEIIVSLTSYGKRLYDAAGAIESIMQQTMRPNRIILNLDKDALDEPLPIALQRQMKRGLEVEVEDEHIRSYKKLIPTMRRFPNAIIITIDDDCIYDCDVVERLFKSYLHNKNCVSALRTHTIQLNKEGKPKPYLSWIEKPYKHKKGNLLFPTGVGGVLYPPGVFNEEVFNQDAFTKLAPTADDVWFHAMALLNGTEIVKAVSRHPDGADYVTNYDIQDVALFNSNGGSEQQNDSQIKAVYDRYDIYPFLKK